MNVHENPAAAPTGDKIVEDGRKPFLGSAKTGPHLRSPLTEAPLDPENINLVLLRCLLALQHTFSGLTSLKSSYVFRLFLENMKTE